MPEVLPTCLGMVSTYCLEVVANTSSRRIFGSRISAHLMLINTPEHKQTCRACAEVCDPCAASCEKVGGMDGCVRTYRSCAETCRAMAA